MKYLERKSLINTLEVILQRVDRELNDTARFTGVKMQDIQQDLELVAFHLDTLLVEDIQLPNKDDFRVYEKDVEKIFNWYKTKKLTALKEVLNYLRVELKRVKEVKEEVSKVLEDGVYVTLKQSSTGCGDEIIVVEDGKVIWKNWFQRLEFGEATRAELNRVIEQVKSIIREVDEDFESTTDEV